MSDVPGTDDRDDGPLTDERLISILRKEEQQAEQWQDAELSDIRRKALDYYDRQPLGDEEEGQSKVVTSEFADTVESIMPSMMRVFASGEDVVEFTPMAPADEEWAKQASQYIPHVLMRENPGFVILHDFIKDALMYRLGGTNTDLEEVEKSRTDPVERWTDEELAAAQEEAKDAGADEVLIEVQPDEMPMEPGSRMAGSADAVFTMPPEGEAQPPAQTYSGTITLKFKRKRVVIDGIAPEDIRFTPGARNQRAASYQGYLKKTTASELRKLGLSQEDIDELVADPPLSSEEDQRNDGQTSFGSVRKDSERQMWVVVAYVKVDVDGDGISEMLRVVYAHAGGNAAKIIEKVEWDEEAPIALMSPILMPHTLSGRSLFDQTEDLQDVGTALTRGMLDNLYLTNRPRPAINGRVSISSVIDWTPGMPVQVSGNEDPRAAIAWLQVQSIIGDALAGMQHFDQVRENRTGVSRYGQGLDGDSLNQTASGITQIMSAAAQRQELMARVMAATGITKLMRDIYRAVKRAAKGPIKYYANGDWAECDPTKWPDDMHLVVAVGTGTGNKVQELQHLMMLGNAQKELAKAQGPLPIVTPEHAANTVRKMAEAMGFRATQQFVASPKEIKAAALKAAGEPPQETPEVIKAKSDAQIAMFEAQQKAGLAKWEAQQRMQLEYMKAGFDFQLDQQELQHETRLKALDIATNPKPAPNATNIEQQQVTS